MHSMHAHKKRGENCTTLTLIRIYLWNALFSFKYISMDMIVACLCIEQRVCTVAWQRRITQNHLQGTVQAKQHQLIAHTLGST